MSQIFTRCWQCLYYTQVTTNVRDQKWKNIQRKAIGKSTLDRDNRRRISELIPQLRGMAHSIQPPDGSLNTIKYHRFMKMNIPSIASLFINSILSLSAVLLYSTTNHFVFEYYTFLIHFQFNYRFSIHIFLYKIVVLHSYIFIYL